MDLLEEVRNCRGLQQVQKLEEVLITSESSTIFQNKAFEAKPTPSLRADSLSIYISNKSTVKENYG